MRAAQAGVQYSRQSQAGLSRWHEGTCHWHAERDASSTHREMVGYLQALRSFSGFVQGSTLKLYTDSQAGCQILEKGCSSKHALHRLVVDIFWECTRLGVSRYPVWVPRELNAQADYLAGIYDGDDWQLNPHWFHWLDSLWGPHTVDRFGTDKNALLPRFNSRWWCPGSENVDCFSLIDWWLENNWCNPPFGMVGRLLEVLRRFSAVATIIVPYWTGRHWWPLICPDGQNFAPFIRDWRELPRDTAEALFLPGAGRANERAVGPPNFRVLALRVDYSA
ncbi:hypothetical protein CYMTET_27991 [Cymbomonas tetramitiformis]|uniref:RNase H type-1 domain-containing protein n=2 Tax=Cymbomonas tetramitiformis TaxID=36881 RepID=A0AAE0FP24_9CHLO|nr:hypothetical protein CYMTET_27991 [Cymbomonas tetramitiformis]